MQTAEAHSPQIQVSGEIQQGPAEVGDRVEFLRQRAHVVDALGVNPVDVVL